MNLTLEIFFLLLENKPLQNREVAEKLDTNIRNVQRSIDKIKTTFEQSETLRRHFKFIKHGRLHTISQNLLLDEEEILLLTKILVSSRSLNKTELPALTEKMISMVGVENHKVVKAAVASEQLTETYIDDESFRKDKLWELEQYIYNKDKIRFDYTDHERQESTLNIMAISVISEISFPHVE